MRVLHSVIWSAFAAAAATSMLSVSQAQQRPWGEGYIPNLPVQNQNAETLHFYDDLIKGKIVVISFIYTSCTDICPLTTARLTQLEDKLGELMAHDIFFISMTVDPEHDRPEQLKEFSQAFKTGPGWTFVTGRPE